MTDPLSALTAEEQAARDRLRREVDPTYPSPYTDLVSQDKDVTSLCDACERLAQEIDTLTRSRDGWKADAEREVRNNADKAQEQADAIKVLAPNMLSSGLVDACRQVKQAAISEAANSEWAEQEIARLKAALESLRKPFEALLIAEVKTYGGIPNRSRMAARTCGPELAALIDMIADALVEEP